MSHAIAPAPIVAAEAPLCVHGETAENPSPVPRERRISEREAATKAPPMTAAQDNAEQEASILPALKNVSLSAVGRDEVCAAITCLLSRVRDTKRHSGLDQLLSKFRLVNLVMARFRRSGPRRTKPLHAIRSAQTLEIRSTLAVLA